MPKRLITVKTVVVWTCDGCDRTHEAILDPKLHQEIIGEPLLVESFTCACGHVTRQEEIFG